MAHKGKLDIDELNRHVGVGPGNEVFLKLLSRDRHRLFAFIYTLIPDHNDAEDVFQDTSIVLWNKFQEFDRDQPFMPWACGFAFNTARNFVRADGRDRLAFSDSLLAVIATERTDTAELDQDRMKTLNTCIEKLTTKERTLLGQACSGERTMKDLAQQLNRATQTIYNSLNVIRRKLTERVRLNGTCPYRIRRPRCLSRTYVDREMTVRLAI